MGILHSLNLHFERVPTSILPLGEKNYLSMFIVPTNAKIRWSSDEKNLIYCFFNQIFLLFEEIRWV